MNGGDKKFHTIDSNFREMVNDTHVLIDTQREKEVEEKYPD